MVGVVREVVVTSRGGVASTKLGAAFLLLRGVA